MKKLERVIEYGLYLLAFVLPIQTRLFVRSGEINGGFFEYGTVSLYGTDILIILLIGLFFILKIKKLRNFKNIRIIWWILAGLEITVFISIFQAIDKSVAFYKYSLFMLGVGVFWMLGTAVYDRRKLIYAFVFGAVLQAGLGGWQFFMQKAFALKWFGLSEHLPFGLGDSVIESLFGVRWLRAYGGVDHPNVFGGYLAIVLLFLIIINLKTIYIRKASTSNESISNGLKYFIFPLLPCILFLGMFLSFSRASWLALIVGLFAMVVLVFYKKNTERQYVLFKNVFVVLIFGIMLVGIFSELIVIRFSFAPRLEQKSYVERVESIKTAKVVVQDNWLFGVGLGNYTQYVHKKLHGNLDFWDYQPVHNVFLLVLAEIGIFGLLFYASFILYSLSLILKSKDYLFVSIVISLLTLFMFDHWFWSLHFGAILFWFVMGAVMHLNRKLY